MDDWNILMRGRFFITNLGQSQQAVVEGIETLVGRYAVWAPVTNSTSHQIVEVGDQSAKQIKYNS